MKNTPADQLAVQLGLDRDAEGLVSWDVYDAVLSPGHIILMLGWRDHTATEAFEQHPLPDGAPDIQRVP